MCYCDLQNLECALEINVLSKDHSEPRYWSFRKCLYNPKFVVGFDTKKAAVVKLSKAKIKLLFLQYQYIDVIAKRKIKSGQATLIWIDPSPKQWFYICVHHTVFIFKFKLFQSLLKSMLFVAISKWQHAPLLVTMCISTVKMSSSFSVVKILIYMN